MIQSPGRGPQGVADSATFVKQLGVIDALRAALPADSRELRHFLERRSYQKALDYLRAGEAARGACC